MIPLFPLYVIFRCYGGHRDLHSFPTRRSSDLERPLKDIRDEYNYPKKKGIKDECSRLLEASTMKSRRGFAIERLMNAMRHAHADGWFIVFDTLTLADDRLEAFYDNPNALRDYFRDIGDRKSGSAGMPRPISYAVFCLKKKK